MNPINTELASEPLEPKQQPSLIEQLLSPQVLQRMMGCGGGLLVLGFVAWLWSVGLFTNPIFAATAIGAVTLGVLGIGMTLVRYSRYQLAGSGITLLAELALPLNLWFYDAQGLITISEGGRLWIPAAVCCGIYALIARVLRRPMFVYTLVGGIVMTGMLFLADQSVAKFWQLLPQVTFLVLTGWVCIFAERLFPQDDSEFSQEQFGYAFHRAGALVLLSGLALLLGGQLAGVFSDSFHFQMVPSTATSRGQKLWALGLLISTVIGSTVQRIASDKQRHHAGLAIGVTGWCVVMLLDLFAIQLRLPHVAIVASMAVIGNFLRDAKRKNTQGNQSNAETSLLPASLAMIGLVMMGLAQFGAQFFVGDANVVFAPVSWIVAMQLELTALASFAAWYVVRTKDEGSVAADLAMGVGAVMAMLATCTTTAVLGLTSMGSVALLGFCVPAGFSAYALLVARSSDRDAWQNSAAISNILLMLYLVANFGGSPSSTVGIQLGWTCVCVVSSLLFFGAGYGRTRHTERVLGSIMAIIAVSQLMIWAGMGFDYAVVLAATLSGMALAIVGRIWSGNAPSQEASDAVRSEGLVLAANWLVMIGSVSGILLVLCRVVAQEVDVELFALLGTQLAALATTSLCTQSPGWRHGFRAAGMGSVLAVIAAFNSFITTHWLLRVEMGAVVLGVALLVLGHIAWYREEEAEGGTQDDGATMSLWLGSLLTTIPLGLGLMFFRMHDQPSGWILFHNVAAIIVALGLLGLGMACRIRSTTLGGTGLLTVYIVTLVTLIQWPSELQSVSVVMMVGGGLFFATAVMLSVYRDRLVSLPTDIRDGRGVFRVLRWR